MMSGTFSSIMRAGCCSATLIGRSRWVWRIPLPPRMAPSFRLPTASPGSASSSRRCAGCCPPPSSGLGGTRCSALPCRGQPVRFCAPAGRQKLARERWCFPHLAVCCLLCCLPCGSARSAIPRWPASGCFCWRCMPFWNTVKTCTAARPNSPGPCRCWPFWRWASTRTFCRWS